jgi:CBS domain containing-hemolysin-like protein
VELSIDHLFAIIPPLLLIEGFFSGSEIALLSADRLKLKASAKRGSKRAKLTLELVSHPERVFSSTLFITALCIVGISSLFELYFLGQKHPHPELMSIAVASPLIVIFGELVPKTLGRRFSDRLSIWISGPVIGAYYLFYPFTRLIAGYTNRLSRVLGPIEEMLTGKKKTTRDELRSLLSYGKNESEIKPSEKKMIKRIFDFSDTEAKHALIPLVRVEAIDDKAIIRVALERFRSHRHSRMPVYSGRIDNITGILDVSDLFGMLELSQPITGFITPARYVAETQSLEDVLFEMNRDNEETVVVVDEYGGAVGILTLEDIVEEIVGEIQDEYDSESSPFKELGPYSWMVQARMEISEINERLKLELPEGDYETLGGFLLQQFGRIPEVRDELYFDTPRGSLKFSVKKASERQIESVIVEELK